MDQILEELAFARLGDKLDAMIQIPCYRVSTIHEPNGYLHVSWFITDREYVDLTYTKLMDRYIHPSLLSLAAEIDKYDVCLHTSMEIVGYGAGVWMMNYVTDMVPVRLTVGYDAIPECGPPGHRFTLDLLTDLLRKEDLE